MKFIWRINRHQFSSGSSLYVNRIRMGQYGWNGLRNRDERKEGTEYVGSVFLPGLGKSVYGGSEKEIRNKMELMVSSWFKETLRRIS